MASRVGLADHSADFSNSLANASSRASASNRWRRLDQVSNSLCVSIHACYPAGRPAGCAFRLTRLATAAHDAPSLPLPPLIQQPPQPRSSRDGGRALGAPPVAAARRRRRDAGRRGRRLQRQQLAERRRARARVSAADGAARALQGRPRREEPHGSICWLLGGVF